MSTPICRRLEMHFERRARSFACESAGSNKEARIAMIAMTTNLRIVSRQRLDFLTNRVKDSKARRRVDAWIIARRQPNDPEEAAGAWQRNQHVGPDRDQDRSPVWRRESRRALNFVGRRIARPMQRQGHAGDTRIDDPWSCL